VAEQMQTFPFSYFVNDMKTMFLLFLKSGPLYRYLCNHLRLNLKSTSITEEEESILNIVMFLLLSSQLLNTWKS